MPTVLGSYVAVCIQSKRSAKVFMAKIVKKLNTDVEVSYMTKGFGGAYLWPEEEERSTEAEEQVLVLNEPEKVTNRGHFMFKNDDFIRIKEHFKCDHLSFN